MGETTSREIQKLRGQIVAWRQARYERAPLPAHIWLAAVVVARRIGVNCARVALGLSYQGLQGRVEQASSAPEFVELSGAEVLAAGPCMTNEIDPSWWRPSTRITLNMKTEAKGRKKAADQVNRSALDAS